jgi:hypothetical protein
MTSSQPGGPRGSIAIARAVIWPPRRTGKRRSARGGAELIKKSHFLNELARQNWRMLLCRARHV